MPSVCLRLLRVMKAVGVFNVALCFCVSVTHSLHRTQTLIRFHDAPRHHRLALLLLPQDEAPPPAVCVRLHRGVPEETPGEPADRGLALRPFRRHQESAKVQALGSRRKRRVRVRNRRPAARHGRRLHRHRSHPGDSPRGRAVSPGGRRRAARPVGDGVSQPARAGRHHREVPGVFLHADASQQPARKHPLPAAAPPQQEDHREADGERAAELQPTRGEEPGGHPHAEGDVSRSRRRRGKPSPVVTEAAESEPVHPAAPGGGVARQPGLPEGAGLHHGGAAPPGVQPPRLHRRAAAREHASRAGIRGGRARVLQRRAPSAGRPLPRRPLLLAAHVGRTLPGADGRRDDHGAGEGGAERAGADHADRPLPHPQVGVVRLRRALGEFGRYRGDEERLRAGLRETAAAAAKTDVQPGGAAQVCGGMTAFVTSTRPTHRS